MARTIYCLERCAVNLVSYEAGQVLENIADDLATLLLNAAPTSFSEVDPAAIDDKALDTPPDDKMIKRAPVKK